MTMFFSVCLSVTRSAYTQTPFFSKTNYQEVLSLWGLFGFYRAKFWSPSTARKRGWRIVSFHVNFRQPPTRVPKLSVVANQIRMMSSTRHASRSRLTFPPRVTKTDDSTIIHDGGTLFATASVLVYTARDDPALGIVCIPLWRPLLPYGYSYKASCARRPG